MYCSSLPSDAAEEVDVGKLLHLIHIHRLDHLLVVEQHPRVAALLLDFLANERDIVPGPKSALAPA